MNKYLFYIGLGIMAGLAVFVASVYSLAYIHELINQKILASYGVSSTIQMLPDGLAFRAEVDPWDNNQTVTAYSWTTANMTQWDNLSEGEQENLTNALQQNENRTNSGGYMLFCAALCYITMVFLPINLYKGKLDEQD